MLIVIHTLEKMFPHELHASAICREFGFYYKRRRREACDWFLYGGQHITHINAQIQARFHQVHKNMILMPNLMRINSSDKLLSLALNISPYLYMMIVCESIRKKIQREICGEGQKSYIINCLYAVRHTAACTQNKNKRA